MSRVNVKLPVEAHAALSKLASETRRPMGDLLAEMIEREQRRRLFDEADASYDRLLANPAAWAEYQEEIRTLEGPIMDGLEDDPWVE